MCLVMLGWSSSSLQQSTFGIMGPGLRRDDEGSYFLSGPEIVFDEPSGAACMLGGVCPCGLSAGAPPVPVVIGPVGPCGCTWPLSFNSVLPVECCESLVS